MRFVIWLAIAGVVVYLVQRLRSTAKSASLQKPPVPLESMAQCRHCGIYLPASESIDGPDSEKFCSNEHLYLHISTPD